MKLPPPLLHVLNALSLNTRLAGELYIRPQSRARTSMRVIFVTLAPLIAVNVSPRFLAAQDAHNPPPTSHSTMSSSALAGKAEFQQRCGFCHGADGSGGTGPDLLHSSLVLHDENGNLIVPVVKLGRTDKGMPAFDLSESKIQQIAAFLHEEIKASATIFYTDSTANYSLDRLLVGNAADGKSYFNGKGRCSSCHSTTGDLAHIASKYKPIDLQSRISYPAGALPTVEVILPSGIKVSGEQVFADRFAITLRDSNGRTHSFERTRVKVHVRDPLSVHKAILAAYSDNNIHDLLAYLETLK